MRQSLSKYCHVSGSMELNVEGPMALAEGTTEAEVKAGIFMQAADLIETHSNFDLKGASYTRADGLTLHFDRKPNNDA